MEELQKQFERLKELKNIIDELKRKREEHEKDNLPSTALIIEPRKHRALSFVVRNILENLNLNWSVQIYHGTENREFVETLLETELADFRPRIELKNLGVKNLPNSRAYSQILLQKKFVEEIPTETFLVFQTDSMINPTFKDLIKNFLQYDYVGAPWKDHIVGNGGFSLRKRSMMLKILKTFPLVKLQNHEDVVFAYGSSTVKPFKPTFEEAKEFSVEHIYSTRFFGVHKVWYYQPDKVKEYCELCPGLETLISLQNLSP